MNTADTNKKILITGALGQIGSELTLRLVQEYGADNVIASDIRSVEDVQMGAGHYEVLDVLDTNRMTLVIEKYKVDTVYHLASLLSGTSEKNPQLAWRLNIDPLLHLCEMAREGKIKKIFWPSSIAVFGRNIPKDNVEQEVPLNPSTVYGITKLAGEKWCEYYFEKYGVDVRSIRYPGLISWKTPAGGGTTDYAVEIYYKAVENNQYTSFIDRGTCMPMLYMDDAIQATLDLMKAPLDNISVRTSYNLGGMSFAPEELAEAIRLHQPDFEMKYEPDFRQSIAESWPSSIDDAVARRDWNLNYHHDVASMTEDMLKNLRIKLGK